jgi:hypothetical protein
MAGTRPRCVIAAIGFALAHATGGLVRARTVACRWERRIEAMKAAIAAVQPG